MTWKVKTILEQVQLVFLVLKVLSYNVITKYAYIQLYKAWRLLCISKRLKTTNEAHPWNISQHLLDIESKSRTILFWLQEGMIKYLNVQMAILQTRNCITTFWKSTFQLSKLYEICKNIHISIKRNPLDLRLICQRWLSYCLSVKYRLGNEMLVRTGTITALN